MNYATYHVSLHVGVVGDNRIVVKVLAVHRLFSLASIAFVKGIVRDTGLFMSRHRSKGLGFLDLVESDFASFHDTVAVDNDIGATTVYQACLVEPFGSCKTRPRPGNGVDTSTEGKAGDGETVDDDGA